MGKIASQITSLTIVYSTVYSDADQRKLHSSASLAFVRRIHRGPVNCPHKWPVTRKIFPFDGVIMLCCVFTCASSSRRDNTLGPAQNRRHTTVLKMNNSVFLNKSLRTSIPSDWRKLMAVLLCRHFTSDHGIDYKVYMESDLICTGMLTTCVLRNDRICKYIWEKQRVDCVIGNPSL